MKPYSPIRGRDHDGAYCSELDVRLSAAEYRRQRADRGVCINGEHGPATHGVRCRRCQAVYRYSAAVVEARGVEALDLSDRRDQ